MISDEIIASFQTKRLKGNPIFFIKSNSGLIFKIKLFEKIRMFNFESKKQYFYFSFFIEEKVKEKNMFFKFFSKKKNAKKEFIKIKSSFYSNDLFSIFYPSGVVVKGDLYRTTKDAKAGKIATFAFR
ncbi:hypothetical protein LDC_0202 [sediment metagenome]|uniref:Uncharacterized protein n=1 Tax=sediment metagenome TaxID=749907 RepID=D9PFC3_9ZZZZ